MRDEYAVDGVGLVKSYVYLQHYACLLLRISKEKFLQICKSSHCNYNIIRMHALAFLVNKWCIYILTNNVFNHIIVIQTNGYCQSILIISDLCRLKLRIQTAPLDEASSS